MISLRTPISDAVIRRHAPDHRIWQLADPRHPLRLRYRTDRCRGSWFLLQQSGGKTRWRKLGGWPELSSKVLLQQLPELMGRLLLDSQSPVAVTGWRLVSDLLRWHAQRVATDSQLSADRRADVASVIKCHLLPLLGDLPLVELNRRTLDQRFFQPLQRDYALGSVKLWLGMLKAASARAQALELLPADPLAGIRFSDFTKARIQPKPSRLRPIDAPRVLAAIALARPKPQALLLLMLAHGTRIGETRQARWEHLAGDCWHIPAAHTKTRQALDLPLTPVLQRYLDHYRQRATGPWLFPAGVRRCCSAAEAHQWVSRSGQGAWTAHDLRKLARTRWADQGADYLTGELLLNHALSQLDQAYIHTQVEVAKRQTLETYHQWLLDQGLAALLVETVA